MIDRPVKLSRLPFVRTIYLTAVLIALVGWTWLLFGMVALGAWPIITSTCAMGTNLSFDEEGLELRDMKAVQEEAARALAGLAWDSVRNFNGAQSDQMTIEVRDNLGSVMQVRFAFEIARRQ